MKKSTKKTRKKQDGLSHDSASGSSPNVFIKEAHTVIFNNEYGHPGTDKEVSALQGGIANDGLVLLVKEILEKCPQHMEPLHSLEEMVCDRIRALKPKQNIPSFKAYSGRPFRQFIEQNSNDFCLDSDGENLVVSIAKEKKKKKKEKAKDEVLRSDAREIVHSCSRNSFMKDEKTAEADLVNTLPIGQNALSQPWHREDEDENSSDLNQWETVTKRRDKRGGKQQPSETDSAKKVVSAEEVLIRTLIKKQPGDSVIMRPNELPYKQDRSAFIRDVTCLWNTPGRDKAYILMGIKTCSKPPYTVVGLCSSTDESVYQAMFQRHLFNVAPDFRYREIMFDDVRVGVVEIPTPSCGSPSIFTSDDLAASGFRSNQLMSRKNGQNILVLPHEPLYKEIEEWFRRCKVEPLQDSKQHKDVPSPAGKTQKLVVPSEKTKKNQKTTNLSPMVNSNKSVVPSVQTKQNQTAAKMSQSQGDSYAAKAGENRTNPLMKALNYFQKMHFVLVCGSMQIPCSNVEALAAAPWVAVYDFNFQGRDIGLLNILEDGIMRRRSLSVLTWCDSCKGITEKGTQWWSLMGRQEIPSSLTSHKTQDWFRTVKDKLDKLCLSLTDFAADYTVLNLLLIWPDSEVEARCMHKFLTRLQEYMVFKLVILFADSTKDHSCSKALTLIRGDLDDLETEEFDVDLKDFCAEVERLTQSSELPDKFQYQLPASESRIATLEEKDEAWLRQELDVLYLQSPYSKTLTEQDLNDEADTFFRGGSINWSTLYDERYEHFDVKRVVAKELIARIQKELKEESRYGMVTLYHTPGAGGSTMTRRILWDMHKSVPCVHVKQRSGASLDEIANRLVFLYDKCRTPVLALMDGEDENRIKQLSKQLQRTNVVILYVKRYPYSGEHIKSKEIVYLQGVVQQKESEALVQRYLERCEGDKSKIDSLVKLNSDVVQKVNHEMYEYGMTVYLHEFRGVEAYVKGYLELEENKERELTPWQKCLCFLALVYYYGQSSLPCQFFVSLLGKQSNYKVDLEDFWHQVKMLVVKDDNEAKDQCIRIGHYIIAKEILEQILNRHKKRRCTSADRLSRGATRNLKDLCIDFINEAKRKKIRTSLTSQTISYIMTKTFIFRDNEEVTDIDTREHGFQTKRKPQFSLIMTDLDPEPPYHGRLEILQKLCDTFPDNPNFRAHLGRFYTCCRPEAEQEAEAHFKEALRLCHEQSQKQNKDGQESDKDRSGRLTLMHIYHMYGMFFQARTARFIKSFENAPENSALLEQCLEQIVGDANRACENFVNSRNATPPGHEESYTYTNEIHVRLLTCNFINSHSPEGLASFLVPTAHEGYSTVRTFVTESVSEVDSLIMECYDVQVDDMGVLQKYVQWLHRLFGPCTTQLQTVVKPDLLTSLRLKIIATKLRFRQHDDVGWVDSVMPETEVIKLVEILENIFKEAAAEQAGDRKRMKNKLELDYKDWLLTIRHRQMKQVYSTEQALERVRQWHDLCHSPQSTYYLFVLLSMLGFGSSDSPGNPECLVDAQMMLEQMQKLSKLVLKSRFPREWLGRWDAPGIKRLVSNSNVSHEDRRINNSSRAKLAVCKGTIHARFQKAAGFIDLDLGLNATPVKVFFIPGRADLVESRHGGARVQFHLAFTLDKGYEAYEVRLLDRYRCNICPQKMEMTWDQEEIKCHGRGCNAIVTKNEHSIDQRSPFEDET